MIKRRLDTSVQYIKGIGPKRAKILNDHGIVTVEDMLYYFPRRYEDRAHFSTIADLQAGSIKTIQAQVLTVRQRGALRRSRFTPLHPGSRGFQRGGVTGFTIVEAMVGDQTGKILCVWFNQPYIKQYLQPGESLILYGKVERYTGRLQINSPEFEALGDDAQAGDDSKAESLNLGRIVPIYTAPAGIGQRYFRRVMKQAIDEFVPQMQDYLPYDIRMRNGLLNLAKSIVTIHFPEDLTAQAQAYRRLAFDEFLMFQIPLALRKLRRKEKVGIAHKVDGSLVSEFLKTLSFKLTHSQEQVFAEIKADMSKAQPMQRLLQGDVGSGKTVIATLASLVAIQGGFQVAFMVPTEILARQHYEKIQDQLRQLCSKTFPLRLGLLTGGAPKAELQEMRQKISDGTVDLVIGTHALLDEDVQFANLGLVVIDEQHKFGVGQRALLPKKGVHPDILIMTATPIPRTLAITIYADLDVSMISELPAGRIPIKTIHLDEERRSRAYEILKEELGKKHQAYVIHPVIEESAALDIEGAVKMHAQLKAGILKDFQVGLVHGQLRQSEQEAAMCDFNDGQLDVLVATTVLEVGIDISNATCMIIEHAERFGLAQLHQLRGRIGRGRAASVCILVSNVSTEESKARLEAMVTYHDGFRIAEEDLRIRGPGEFFGSRQHGLTELRIANPLTQLQLLKLAREEALKLLSKDIRLDSRENVLLREKLLQRFPGYDKLVMTG